MASRLLWASRATSYLRISVSHRGFATVLNGLKCFDSHERVKVDENSATVGITDHAEYYQVPKDLKYLDSHEWVKVDGNSATVGITDQAEDDLVLKDLKHLGSHLKDVKYVDSHAWVKVDGNSATVGITNEAYLIVGDALFVGFPEVGASVTQGQCFCTVDGLARVRDFNSPVSGKVIEVNEELNGYPELVTESPYEGGWIIKVEICDSGELNKLMDSDQYKKFCQVVFGCSDLDLLWKLWKDVSEHYRIMYF